MDGLVRIASAAERADTARAHAAAAPHVKLRRIGGNIGAEIEGVHLGRLTDAEFAVVHDALIEHQVIVLRGQDITTDHQMDFGRRFGELSIHPFSPNLDDKREVIILDNGENNPPHLTDQWHADETFRARPPLGTILRSHVSPDIGGDTLFSSMMAAYTGLSPRMKAHIHGMEALHDWKPWRGLFTSAEEHQRKLRQLEAAWPMVWHPVVRVHPVSGRRILNVSAQFVLRLKDVPADESELLLQYLYRRAAIPEYQCRVRWEPNTVVMWDNRSVQHYAAHDYYPQRRTMERVTVAGDPVLGVAGNYLPEDGAGKLPDGKGATIAPPGKRPIREFERDLK